VNKLKEYQISIRCIDCKHVLHFDRNIQNKLICNTCQSEYPVINEIPVLISKTNVLFDPDSYLSSAGGVYKSSLISKMARYIPGISVNMSSRRIFKNIGSKYSDKFTVLIIGAGIQREWITKLLGPKAQCVFTDVDINADVEAYADAHEMPFLDHQFDVLIQTAVLEHVVDPGVVISEITRMIKPNGVVYSEMPFLQQVHEGAYDFFRASMGGHKLMFQDYDELDSGMVAGPFTLLLWTLESILLSIMPSIIHMPVKALYRVIFFWIKYLDYLVKNNNAAIDSASATYFYGQNKGKPRSLNDIINSYRGKKTVKHV
jgi:SAM-dependent methyltransferase